MALGERRRQEALNIERAKVWATREQAARGATAQALRDATAPSRATLKVRRSYAGQPSRNACGSGWVKYFRWENNDDQIPDFSTGADLLRQSRRFLRGARLALDGVEDEMKHQPCPPWAQHGCGPSRIAFFWKRAGQAAVAQSTETGSPQDG